MIEIYVREFSGNFAEDKDAAREVREQEISPSLSQGNEITLDFAGIDFATQSFIHALISEVIRTEGEEVLDAIIFKNCNDAVSGIIQIVCDYTLETLE